MGKICLPAPPPRVRAELEKIALGLGHRSLEDWARFLLVHAAEEARPSLKGSGMWSRDTSQWYDQLGSQ